MKYKGTFVCERCKGSGFTLLIDGINKKCPKCNGAGVYSVGIIERGGSS